MYEKSFNVIILTDRTGIGEYMSKASETDMKSTNVEIFLKHEIYLSPNQEDGQDVSC